MLKKIIALALVVALYFGISSIMETKAEANQKKSTPVYQINSVASPKDGHIVDFKFTQDGKERSFAELTKNKVLFINFWGTWCGPCRREIPDIIEISKDLKGKDFMVIGIALEHATATAAATKVSEYGTDKGIEYINFIGNDDLKRAYGGIPAVPTTLIVDKTGKIVEKIVGMRDKNTFMASINRVLK